ncbi:peptidoglycan D,D-transpeptidase FtsI family protein [Companilactobacillus sp. DQM5]|uniref:peptidoglycan D,D-transpeptidase FtsI family protein n=1 Tax=Companilactobacillus sp. DQM5 TaxID=3463359 RepID=UPI0040581D3C
MNIFKRKTNKKRGTKSILPFRLNLLFFIVFLLFAALIAQLAYLQIVYGGKFQAEVSRTDKSIITSSVPRGIIYDSKGRAIVSNKAENAITFTKSSDIDNIQMYNTANKLSRIITVDTDKLTSRQEADYYLANTRNYQKELGKLPRNKKYNGKEQLENSVIYKNLVDFVKKEDIHLTKQQQNAAAIFNKMSSSYQLSTTFIKSSDVTSNEMAQVGEHLTELPGIGLGTDWNRNYPEGESIRELVGNVSSEKQGLPEDQISELLAKGYSRNDRVGTSYLEKSYESVLSGSKTKTQLNVNSKNKVTDSKVVYKGTSGDNLTLTIDSEFQNSVENILKQTFASAKANGVAQYADGAYAVAMNPKTGAILAMAGINSNPKTGEQQDDALGVINRTFVMGSVVKGATVLGGLMDGAITPSSNTMPDDPIYLPGTPVKKSSYPIGTFGALNATSALEYSSNTYMMHLALKEANAKYIPNKYIKMDPNIFSKLRGYFNQFGLGVKTGIDLPGEAAGIEGPTLNEEGQVKVGSALDLSFGNYDSYTIMQLGQYVSTIANNGYRMKPYVVQSISSQKGDKTTVNYNASPQVMNKIDATSEQIGVVKQGFYQVIHGAHGWTTGKPLQDVKPEIAGKTGTAQSFYYDPQNPDNPNPPETITDSFIGYAPYNDPQIAIALVFPNLTSEKGGYNTTAAKEIIQEYFKENSDSNDKLDK